MKSIIPGIFILLTVSLLNAQQCIWLEGQHGSLNESGTDIAAGVGGQSLSCGYFTSDLMWVGDQYLIRKSIDSDAYVIKRNSNGEMIWMDNPGGLIFQKANGIIMDNSGNTYVTGIFKGSFSFGTSYLEALNGEDCMLLKYDSAGNQIWGKSIGSYGSVKGEELTCDSEGNIFVIGWYNGNSIHFGDSILNNYGDFDIYIAKYNPGGNLLWAQSFGGSEGDYVHGITADGFDDIYICGGFHSSEVTFGNYTLPNSCPKRASFIVKLDPDGNILWADSHSFGSDQSFYGITIDQEGGIYKAGYFKDTFIFGMDTFSTVGSQYDIVLLKYNSSFEPQWAEHIYSSTYDRSTDLDHDNDGNIYMSAKYDGDILIGGILINNHGDVDFLVSKFDPEGALLWVRSAGGSGKDECSSIAFGEPWYLNFTGFFSSDYIYLGGHVITNQAMEDAFSGTFYTYLSADIGENNTSDQLNIYPNPFDDDIIFSQQVCQAQLYDLNGRLLLSEENISKMRVEKGLPPAVYLLLITASEKEQAQVFKVLKK